MDSVDVARGLDVAGSMRDVMPDDAEGRVAQIYDDTRDTLRVPFVNQLFRMLANEPLLLDEAWSSLRPLLRSQRFEALADQLRAIALPTPVQESDELIEAAGVEVDRVRAYTDSIHYVLPKLLLVATLVDRFTAARRTSTFPDTNREEDLPSGPAPGSLSLPLVNPETASPAVRRLFEQIKKRHGHPAVATYFRGLATWPLVLTTAWKRLAPFLGKEEYAQSRRRLVERAEEETERLLEQADDHHVLGSFDDMHALLALFRTRVIPDLMLDVAILKASLDGPEAAAVSRFSAAQEPSEGTSFPPERPPRPIVP